MMAVISDFVQAMMLGLGVVMLLFVFRKIALMDTKIEVYFNLYQEPNHTYGLTRKVSVLPRIGEEVVFYEKKSSSERRHGISGRVEDITHDPGENGVSIQVRFEAAHDIDFSRYLK